MNFVKNHLKVLFGAFALGLIGLATTVFAINWSNTQFIDSAFWAQNPTSGDIVAAVFGSNSLAPTATAYTQNWSSNACLGGSVITVQYVGTDSLPQLLTSNTIYVLTGNQAITGEVTFLGSCIALLSSGGQYGLTKGTGGILGINNAMLYANNASNIIIDGIWLDADEATQDANMGLYIDSSNVSHFTINNISARDSDDADIFVFEGSDIDIYNSVIGDHATAGISASLVNSLYLNNVEIYNTSTFGLRLFNTSGSIVTNSRFHDNGFANIYLDNADDIMFNNIQSYNNLSASYPAIDITNGSNGVSINNSMIYNSAADGIRVLNAASVLIHNTVSTSNAYNGIYIDGGVDVILSKAIMYANMNWGVRTVNNASAGYYNVNPIYSNKLGNLNIAPLTQFGTGLSTDSLIAGLSWSNGSVDETALQYACYRRSYPQSFITNFSNNCGDDGYQVWTPIVAKNTTLFGEITPLQLQPVHYYPTPNNLVLYAGGLYNANLHIADSYNFGGRLTATGGVNYQGNPRWYTTGTQLVLYSSEATNYVITGDLMQTYTGTINGSTTINIQWSTGDGLKVVTGYYYTGTKQSPLYRVIRYYDTTAPAIPTNTTPVNSGTFVGDAIQLIWDGTPNDMIGAAGSSGYNRELSTNSGFTNIVQSGTGDNSNFVNLTGLVQTIYYRRVRAFDHLWNTSARSTGTMFQYDFSGFVISVPNSSNLNANVANNVSISLYDTANNVLTGYNGTVAWTITGVNTPPNPPYNSFTIPSTSGLVASANGVYTFTGGLNITYPGEYQLTVYDVNNPTISGSINVIVYGVLPSTLSGSIVATPQYSNGSFTVDLSTNIEANYTLTGPFTTMNGTLNTTASLPTAFNTVVEGSYNLNVAYTTGFYVYTASTNVILDTTAPTVQVVSPTSGSTTSGSIVNISWTGSEFGTPSFSGYNITVTDGTTVVQQTGYGAQSMTLTLTDGVRTITVTAIDQAGNTATAASTFTVDTTIPTITNPYPSQNTIGTTPFNFTWTHVDVGGFSYATITLYDNDGNIVAGPAISYGTSVNLSTNLGVSTLPNGIYQWTVTSYDNAGNSTNGGPYIFTVLQPVSLGQIAGVMDLASLFGTVVQSGNTYYTNTTQLQAILASNMSTSVSINGNLSPTIIGFNLFAPFPYGVQAIQLTAGDGLKNLTALFTTGVLTPFSTVKSVILDTISPTNLTLLSPANGGTVTGTFTLDWSDAVDSGAGLSGYVYHIDNNSGFSSIDVSGNTVNSTVTLTTGGLSTGTYYWRVRAYDIVSNMVTSDTGSFIIGTTTVISTDTTADDFDFDDVDDADLDESYTSDEITVSGLGNGVQVLASVTDGVLFINGSVVGTTGMVDNGDEIEVEMISSDEEDEEVSTTLSIGSVSDEWTITTTDNSNDDENDLSRGERLQLALIFDLLVDTYEGNPSRALAFFQTLENAIESLLDDNDLSNGEEQSLEYFLELIQDYLDDEFDGVETVLIYTAPNNKKYRVAFDETRNAYYSPDFIKPAFFDTKESFAAYIDRQNPGAHAGSWSDGELIDGSDGIPSLGSNVIVAPNGKVYRIVKSGNLWTSPDFQTPRTFASETELRNFIISHNR